MTTFRPVQEAFTAGEISPLFHSQQSSELYQNGLKRCRNMFPLTQGGVRSRPGLRYLATPPGAIIPIGPPTNARVIPIEISQETWAVAVMGGGGLQVITDETLVTELQYVTNPEFEDGLSGWTPRTIGNAGVAPRTVDGDAVCFKEAWLDVGGEELGTAIIEQVVQIDAASAVDLTIDWKFSIPDDSEEQLPGVVTMTVYRDAFEGSDLLFASAHAAEPGEGDTIRANIPNTAGHTGPLYVRVRLDGTAIPIFMTSNKALTHHLYIRGPAVDVPPPDIITIPYSDEELDAVQYMANPYNDAVFFVHKDYFPRELTLDGTDWVFQEIDLEEGPGADPPWDPVGGYPSVITGYQGRCVMGGTPSQPQTIWTSAPGNWYDWSIDPDPDAADEPLEWTLSERGAVRWVHGHRQLLHGTSISEYAIQASGGLLQPGDIQASKHSGYGNKAVQPVDTGEGVLTISPDGLKARILRLNRERGWEAANATWSAEHITFPGVRYVAIARDPFQVVWMPLVNGTMAGLTFEPSHELLSWHLHETDGEFIDSCNARVADDDYTFFLVRRYIEGAPVIMLEMFHEDAFMDSHVHQVLGDPATEITGLDHLEGRTVQIIGDSTVRPQQIVVDGSVTLEEPASEVFIGLPFTSLIETLPAPSPGQVGGLGAEKSWAEIGVRMVNSRAPLVNGIRQDEDTDDPMMVELGWDKYATIVVEQDRPLPLAVTGIYGRLSTEDIIG